MKICLNMIVKNESKVIERCLRSVMPWIDYWVIADTGSSDGTEQKIQEVLSSIPGELHKKPWVNFAHNRNEVLELSKGKGDYLLLIDADEWLLASPEFTLPKLTKDVYGIVHRSGDIDFQRCLLLNNHLPWKWEGVIHEEPKTSVSVSVGFLAGLINVCTQEGARSQDPFKFEKDLLTLHEALEKEPDHPRYLFYLAESYLLLGKDTDALAFYQKRAALGPPEQEMFWSLYQIGRIQERLKLAPEVFIASYCLAYQYRPSRAEPLFFLIQYYLSVKAIAIAHVLAKSAVTMTRPKDAHFIEGWMYDWGLSWSYMQTTFQMGLKREGMHMKDKLLKNPLLPDRYKDSLRRIE